MTFGVEPGSRVVVLYVHVSFCVFLLFSVVSVFVCLGSVQFFTFGVLFGGTFKAQMPMVTAKPTFDMEREARFHFDCFLLFFACVWV